MSNSANNHGGNNGIQVDMTRHPWRRMTARSITSSAVEATLEYGRVAYVRGAAISYQNSSNRIVADHNIL